MTVVDSPEKILFASTTQAFLQKEVPLSRVRDIAFPGRLLRTGLVAAGRGSGMDGTAGARGTRRGQRLRRWCAPTWRWSPNNSERRWRPARCIPVSTVLAALVDSADPQSHAATIESLDRRRHRRLVGGVRAGTGLGAAQAVDDCDRDRNPATGSTASKTAWRRARRATCCSWWPRPTMGCANSWSRPTRPACVSSRSSRSIWSSSTPVCISTGSTVDRSAAVDGNAADLLDRQSQIAQLLQCAEVVGILQTVFDFTVAWALDRHTFGRPLASYQALKHRFADMKMWLEACRATTAAAVTAISSRSPEANLSASIAKSYVGEMATEIIQGCVQMHGGIGVTWEHDLHVYLRRAALYRSMFGTPEEHNLRVYRVAGDGATGAEVRLMTEVTDNGCRRRIRRRVPGTGTSLAGREHAGDRSRGAAGGPPRRGSLLAARPRTAKAAL